MEMNPSNEILSILDMVSPSESKEREFNTAITSESVASIITR